MRLPIFPGPMHDKRFAERGFTLLELMLVFGLGALILISGVFMYRQIADGRHAVEAQKFLLYLQQQTWEIAAHQGGLYTGIAFDSATSDETNIFVAKGLLREGQRNVYGGVITIASTAPNTFDLTFENVSRAGCMRLFTTITSSAELSTITVNGMTSAWGDVTLQNAAANCNAATNDILWTLK